MRKGYTSHGFRTVDQRNHRKKTSENIKGSAKSFYDYSCIFIPLVILYKFLMNIRLLLYSFLLFTSITAFSQVYFSYQPPILPIEFRYDFESGPSISLNGRIQTPIGSFELGYSEKFMRQQSGQPYVIYRDKILREDVMLVLIDPAAERETIYKIEKGMRFKANVSGDDIVIEIKDNIIRLDISKAYEAYVSMESRNEKRSTQYIEKKKVRLVSEPAGALVYVDNNGIPSRTPCNVLLTGNSNRIRFVCNSPGIHQMKFLGEVFNLSVIFYNFLFALEIREEKNGNDGQQRYFDFFHV